MAITNLRDNIVLAFDGGGVRGIISALALGALEKQLKVTRLIDAPQVKIITGTSTGAIIATAVALGMTSAEIVALYKQLAPIIFPRTIELPASWRDKLDKVIKVFSLPDNTAYVEKLKEIIEKHTDDANITLGKLHKDVLEKKGKVLLITTVNVYERRTRFLKSCTQGDKTDLESDPNWCLWEAVVASSAAPTYFPVLVRQRVGDDGKPKGKANYYIDGGTGSYNNPAYVAAREAVDFQCYPRHTVSVLSFGTGWFDQDDFEASEPESPDTWNILDWAAKVPLDIMMSEAARVQSLDVLNDFVRYTTDKDGNVIYDNDFSVDFRRFQIRLNKKIDLDDSRPETLDDLERLGKTLVDNIRHNHYLTSDNIIEIAKMPNTKDFTEEADVKDPEGISQSWRRSRAADCKAEPA